MAEIVLRIKIKTTEKPVVCTKNERIKTGGNFG